MGQKILFVGGSPCSGKSTVAERMAKEYAAYYFKVDDFLDEWIGMAADKGYPACKRSAGMTPDEMWMREPLIQCKEEFLTYDEISEFLFARLGETDHDFIVTEGAAYTPGVMKKYMPKNYISMVPTPEFQVSHYRQREWVPYVLEGCSDKERAFDNWMKRDILFAEQVKEECGENGIPCIVNDGKRTEDELFYTVRELFALT